MSMKVTHLLALSAAMSAILILAASEADAQGRVVKGGWGNPPRHGGGMHRGHGKFGGHGFIAFPAYVVEREVVHVIEREVVVEEPAAPAEPPPPPAEPHVIGKSYASLPGGCMKLIEEGASYYYCSGEWYRQEGAGGGARYRAVAHP